MQIVYFDGRDRHELDVRVNNPSATVDDLALALDPRGGERTLLVGDHPADPDFELTEAGLHEGAVVRFGPPRGADRGFSPPPPAPVLGRAPARELVVVNGLDSGRRFPLVPGTLVIGRAPGCDILLRDGTLSRRHAGITTDVDGEITIDDYQSHNGTWVAGEAVLDPVPLAEGVPLRLGALDLEVRAVRDDDKPVAVDPLRHTTAAGTIPFNRPPRPAPPPAPPDLRAPRPPKSGQGKVPFSLLGCLAPLLLAGGMYITTKSPQMLMFAGLTPVMAVANAVDGKRKGRKTERSEKERFAKEMVDFRERLTEAADTERARRELACPDPAEISRRVALPSTMLWERRLGHADFLSLRAGVGDVPWRPPVPDVDVPADAPDDLKGALDEHALLPGSPVPVDLSEGGVVGIVGDRPAALALARSLLCQAAILHGPADLPMMVLARADTAGAWDWVKWLPHTRDSSGSGRMLSSDPEMSTRLVEGRLRAYAASERSGPRSVRREGRDSGPPILVVVDDELLTEGRKAPTRSLLRGEGGAVAGIVVASTADRLPAVCTTVVEMTDPDGGADLTLPQRGERIAGFLPAGMADDVARDCARSLARFEDPELDLVGAGLPATIRLLPLLEMEECTPEAVLSRWKAGGPDPRPAAPVGRDGGRRVLGRLRGRRPPRPGGRHHGRRQVRAAAHAGGQPGRQRRPRPPDVRARRLQGRQCVRRVRQAAAHRGHGHRPRRAPGRAGAAVPGGRAQVPGAHAARRGGGRPARLPAQGPQRADAAAGRHHRRVRHAQGRAARVHRRAGRRGAAGPQPRGPHAAGHPAPAGRHQREHQGQHQHAHRPAGAGGRRLARHHRRHRRRRHPPHGARPGLRAARAQRGRGHPVGAVDRVA